MITDAAVKFVVLTQNPRDYPGRCVARARLVMPGGTELVSNRLSAIADSPDELRAVLRQSLGEPAAVLPRCPADDPVIVESWLY